MDPSSYNGYPRSGSSSTGSDRGSNSTLRELVLWRHNSNHHSSSGPATPPAAEVPYAQREILSGFHNQALLDGTGYSAAMFGIILGQLLELWTYQGEILVIKRPSELTRSEARKAEGGPAPAHRLKQLVIYLCLCVCFMLLSLLTDHTEVLYTLHEPREG